MKKKSQTTKVMAENNRKVNKKFLTQPDKDSVQVLLDDVEQRRFFVDITEDEYDALTEAEKKNGNLYLIKEDE